MLGLETSFQFCHPQRLFAADKQLHSQTHCGLDSLQEIDSFISPTRQPPLRPRVGLKVRRVHAPTPSYDFFLEFLLGHIKCLNSLVYQGCNNSCVPFPQCLIMIKPLPISSPKIANRGCCSTTLIIYSRCAANLLL